MRREVAGGLAVLTLVACAVAALVLWPRDPGFQRPRGLPDLLAWLDRVVPAEMREHHVPGAALAVVHDGRVVATRGYGDVTPRTPLQVGSVSKPVAALGLLRLAARRDVAPDAMLPVRGWGALTLRQLLSHTAGLSVDGYLGLEPGRPLPTTRDEVLGRGEGPAVERVDPPGRSLRYSGGGYTVAQLWAEQAASRPFAELMEQEVLRPLGMRSSTFEQDAPPRGAAAGHDAAGRPVPSYRYAALAAAGLWSTAEDVGRFLAFATSRDPVASAMRAPAPGSDGRWGMGLELQRLRDGGALVEHEGVNRGWRAQVAAAEGWGLAVLTDADGGGAVTDAAVKLLVR